VAFSKVRENYGRPIASEANRLHKKENPRIEEILDFLDVGVLFPMSFRSLHIVSDV
jgi:hypothetical protein